MADVHPRSDNLKLGLEYQQWELLGSCARTMARGLRFKKNFPEARVVESLVTNVDEVLAAMRAEGHV